jgi:transcriptional regulator with XRE-family HTH domain
MTPHKSPQTPIIAADTLNALAHTVRAARDRKGWTVAALAERSGLSKGMLLQIEGARTNPSIGTLIRIANAFGVGVWQLFASPEDTIRTATPRDALTLWRSRRGGRAVLLVGSESPQPVELWEWRLAPADVYSADAHTRQTFEVIHVRRGTLTLVVGRRRVEIATGGSVVARMDQRHQYRNEGRTPVTMSMVVVDPRP